MEEKKSEKKAFEVRKAQKIDMKTRVVRWIVQHKFLGRKPLNRLSREQRRSVGGSGLHRGFIGRSPGEARAAGKKNYQAKRAARLAMQKDSRKRNRS